MTVCENQECTKNAYFNIPEQKKGRFCSTHKEPNMINVKDKHCFEQGCCQRPSFNILGKKPLFCGTHKTSEMVNVMTKFCHFNGCYITPVYNDPDKKTGKFCVTHKESNMINVVSNSCRNEGCHSIPSFGITSNKPTHCLIHKTEEMIDVKHKKCNQDSCNKIPCYANPTDTIPTHCSEHKTEEMVNVKHKKCNEDGCNKIPSYNYIGIQTAKYCKNHKLDEMVDVTHKKCRYEGCIIRPTYNIAIENIPKFCFTHKTIEMIDVYNKKCINEWCENRNYDNKYEGYCINCFIHMFPDKPNARNYKTKEQSVVEYIKNEFPNFTWICDKRVIDGCSRRRPDLFLDLGFQIIIVEVDENQHINYDCSCENRRLMELSQDVGHRPIVFIRFNPDDYILKDKSKIKSCWTTSKATNLVSVDKNKRKQWNHRLETLGNWIKYWSENKTDKVVEVVQLFFDE